LTIGTSGGLLWKLWWTFVLHKLWEISWLAEELLASQGGLCLMELVKAEHLMVREVGRGWTLPLNKAKFVSVTVHVWPLCSWLWSMAGWRASKTFSRCTSCNGKGPGAATSQSFHLVFYRFLCRCFLPSSPVVLAYPSCNLLLAACNYVGEMKSLVS